MKIADVLAYLETVAPFSYQENYDNAGLLTGDAAWQCTGILCTLDATEEVIREAIAKKMQPHPSSSSNHFFRSEEDQRKELRRADRDPCH